MKIDYEINIHSDIKSVYDHLVELDKQKLWIKGLQDSQPANDPDNPNKYILTIKEGGKVRSYTNIVHKQEEPKTVEIEMSDEGGFSVYVTYNLIKLSDKITRLEYKAELKVNKTFHKIMLVLVGYLFSKLLVRSQMKLLKKVVEEANS